MEKATALESAMGSEHPLVEALAGAMVTASAAVMALGSELESGHQWAARSELPKAMEWAPQRAVVWATRREAEWEPALDELSVRALVMAWALSSGASLAQATAEGSGMGTAGATVEALDEVWGPALEAD